MPFRIGHVMPKKIKPSYGFGERLCRLRTELGITQSELAERIGSTQRCISAYETITEYPPTSVLVELAKVLKVSTDELLGLKPVNKAPGTTETLEEKRLWKKFRKVLSLPERDKRAVIRLVNTLVATTA